MHIFNRTNLLRVALYLPPGANVKRLLRGRMVLGSFSGLFRNFDRRDTCHCSPQLMRAMAPVSQTLIYLPAEVGYDQCSSTSSDPKVMLCPACT